MSEATYLIGDVFDVMATLPDDSFDMVMTSPPFLALRSYLPADHPDKSKEIGSEPNPAEFLDTLLALTAEWDRLLAPHGSIVVELGDTYSGSGGGGGDYLPGGMREGQQQFAGSAATMRESNAAHWRQKNANRDAWPLAKSLCGIPHLYHLSLAYGRNLLTGEPSPAGQWRVRNVVAWCRPNPPVGALGDKFRPATSYLTIATKSATRYFDLDAVRQPPKSGEAGQLMASDTRKKDKRDGGGSHHGMMAAVVNSNPAGAPPLDWWEIPTAPYKGSHYAVYPPALLERPIKSMCPMHVCTTCGEPRRRIITGTEYVDGNGQKHEPQKWASGIASGGAAHTLKPDGRYAAVRLEGGWTDCGHNTWRNGHVLDPFGGSGTTGAVATGLGRNATLIDIDERNATLAADRIGMFLTIRNTAATTNNSKETA